MFLSVSKPFQITELLSKKAVDYSFFIVETSAKGNELLAKISTSIELLNENECSVQLFSITSKNDNYSFKIELLKQFSKHLREIEKKYKVNFIQILWFYKNIILSQTSLDINLVQKTFAPLLFYNFSSFLYDNDGNSISLNEFIKRENEIGKLIINKK